MIVAFYLQLLDHFQTHQLLYQYQFGFRANHSTNLALTVLIDKITESLNSGDSMVGVFLDFSKAFETVNHSILLSKLEYYGIKNTALRWVESYLNNRSQYVCYNTHSSCKLICKCGVPQGSILGPLFFIIYVNDMANISKYLFLVLFADDTNAFLSGKNIDNVIQSVNVELSILAKWLCSNKLTLNVKKTHFMVFSNSRQQVTKHVSIDRHCIERVSHTKFLGVIIDEKLDFKNHIKHVQAKISKGIGILCRAKKYFDVKTLTELYYSFIHPYLNYCVEIWGSTFVTALDPLVKLQKKA